MHPLEQYLLEVGVDLDDFARTVGVEVEEISGVISGDHRLVRALAQRIVDACGGAIGLNELIGDKRPGVDDSVSDGRARFGAAQEIDADLLTRVLRDMLPALLGGLRRKGDQALAAIAAEAAVNTYAAMSTVTTRQGVDRLAQALLPVLAEILSESSVYPIDRQALGETARQAAQLYFQALKDKRRG